MLLRWRITTENTPSYRCKDNHYSLKKKKKRTIPHFLHILKRFLLILKLKAS